MQRRSKNKRQTSKNSFTFTTTFARCQWELTFLLHSFSHSVWGMIGRLTLWYVRGMMKRRIRTQAQRAVPLTSRLELVLEVR